MGSRIQDFVSITISRESAKLTRAGFGTALLLGSVDASLWTDRVKTFSTPADLLEEGMETTDPLYQAAVKLYSQAEQPEQFKIGRRVPTGTNAKSSVTWSADGTGGMFVIVVTDKNGVTKTTTPLAYNGSAADAEAAIEALSNVAACTVALNQDGTNLTSEEGFNVEFDGAEATNAFTVQIQSNVTKTEGYATATVTVVSVGEIAETWAEAYAACDAADADWYGIIIMSQTAADIEAIAALVEADTRLFYYRTADADNLVQDTGIGATLKAAGYTRSFGVYSTDDDGYLEAACAAKELTKDPGSYTMKFQQVAGVTVEDLTTSYVTNLKHNNLNFIEAVSGYNIITSEGVVADGNYIDNIRFTDWLEVRMREDIFQDIINAGETAGKLPYTREGYAVLESAMRKRLALGVAAGGLVDGTIVVTMPDPDDADPADKAVRTVRLTKVFSAQLAGAVHKTIITGDLVL